MTVREIQVLVEPTGDSHFAVVVEPEGMEYEIPPHEKVLLTFMVPDSATQYFDVAHGPDSLVESSRVVYEDPSERVPPT